jgi:hypothetical protein
MSNIFNTPNLLNAQNLLKRILEEFNKPKKLELKLEYMYLKLEEPEFNYLYIDDLLNNNFKKFLKLILSYQMLKSFQEEIILKHETIEKTPPINKWFISFNKGICIWETLDSLYVLKIYKENYNNVNNLYSVEYDGYNDDIYPPLNDDGNQLKLILEIIPLINSFNSRNIYFFAK